MPSPCRYAPERLFARVVAPLLLVLVAVSGAVKAEALRFDWPAPAQALLTLEAQKGGRTVSTEMVLDVSPLEGGLLRMDYKDVKLLSVDGQDFSSAQAQARLPAAFKAVAAAMPSFIVGPDGEVREIVGLKDLLETVIENTPEDPPRVTREKLREVMLDPQMQKVVRAKAANDWGIWVGIWAGKDIPTGERRDFTTETPVTGGVIPARGYFEHLGEAEGYPGAVRLRMEMVVDGPQFREALFRTLSGLARRAGKPMEGLSADAIEFAERRQIVEVVTDPDTLRPYEAHTTTLVTMRIKDQPERQEKESKSFDFAWKSGE